MAVIEKWMRDLPSHPTPLGNRATEEMSRGDLQRAHVYFRDYLALPRVRREFGAERLQTALAILPTVAGPGAAHSYVLGRPSLTWLLADEHPDWPVHPLCPSPGPALLDRRLARAA
jgi:hypothetical protein